MKELSEWNTLPTAAAWLSKSTTSKIDVQRLIDLCKTGDLRIVIVVDSWTAPGHGELQWFDEMGNAYPANFVSDGCVALNTAMCDEMMKRGRANLRLATMPMVNVIDDAQTVLTAGGENLPFVSLDALRISKGDLESFCKAHGAIRTTDTDGKRTNGTPGPKPKVAEMKNKAYEAAADFFAVKVDGWNTDVWPAWRVLNDPQVVLSVWGMEAKTLPPKGANDIKAFKSARGVNHRAMCDAVNAARKEVAEIN